MIASVQRRSGGGTLDISSDRVRDLGAHYGTGSLNRLYAGMFGHPDRRWWKREPAGRGSLMNFVGCEGCLQEATGQPSIRIGGSSPPISYGNPLSPPGRPLAGTTVLNAARPRHASSLCRHNSASKGARRLGHFSRWHSWHVAKLCSVANSTPEELL